VATAGYSGTPLARKLGIKPGGRVHVIDAPRGFRALLAPLPERVVFESQLSQSADIIVVFSQNLAGLRVRLAVLRGAMRSDAAAWVAWPKKASGVRTDVTENAIRDLALAIGLVDVKVCAIDDVWSGLKVVIRKALR
jgi:hypothetical protein